MAAAAVAVRLLAGAFVLSGVVAACSDPRPPASTKTGVPSTLTPSTSCTGDGATRACHVEMGERNGVRSCFHGTQACSGGVWGPCAGEAGTLSGQSLSGGYLTGSESAVPPGALVALDPQGVAMVTTKSISGSSAEAGGCLSNPCDPTCVGFDEDAGVGITPDSGIVGTSYYGADPLASVPGGFVNKGNEDPCKVSSDCNFDTYCDKTTLRTCSDGTLACGTCKFYQVGAKNTSCTGIDLTAGRACGAQKSYPLCNRGTVDLSQALYPTIDVYKKTGGGNQFGAACPSDLGDIACQITVPATGIKAGTCINAALYTNCGLDSVGNVTNSNLTLFINATYNAAGARKIPECTLGAEPGCVNNWTDVKAATDVGGACTSQAFTSYVPKTYVQTYQASCPTGSVPQWMFLAYDTTTPSSGGTSSTIKLDVRAGDSVDGGTVSYGASVNMALVPTTDPATCPMSGVATCPKDLYTKLGGVPGAQKQMLELTATLTPSSDALVAPTLKSWQVTYSCPPSQ